MAAPEQDTDDEVEVDRKGKQRRIDPVDIAYDEDGLPVLPDRDDPCWARLPQKKAVVGQYIRGHYGQWLVRFNVAEYTVTLQSFAAECAGNPAAKVPWTVIQADSSPYIEPQYLPPNMKLSEPSKMRQQDIDLLLDHWHTRQEDKAVKKIFEFKAYQGGDKEPKSRGSRPERLKRPRARPMYKKARQQPRQSTPETWGSSKESSESGADHDSQEDKGSDDDEFDNGSKDRRIDDTDEDEDDREEGTSRKRLNQRHR